MGDQNKRVFRAKTAGRELLANRQAFASPDYLAIPQDLHDP